MQFDTVGSILGRVSEFRDAAHRVLAAHESASKSRVISVEATRKQLQGLTLNQSGLLREALDCVELGKYRAAHVSGWQAFIDLLSEKMASDGFVKLSAVRPKLSNLRSVEELRETVNDHELIVAAKDLGLISKSEVRILHGMLSERNECGHPSAYRPGLNESLGYVSKLINRIENLQSKSL